MMNGPERSQRYRGFRTDLMGSRLNPELVPSSALVDSIAQMVQDNQLRFIPLETRGTRDAELQGLKVDSTSKIGLSADNSLKVSSQAAAVHTDLQTDWRINNTLQRRSFGLELGRAFN